MSCKSLLYCHNSNTSVETGGTIGMGNIIRRFGKFVNLSGDGILAEESGYFLVNACFTVFPDTAGTVTVSAVVNGNVITDASEYCPVAETAVCLGMTFVVRNSCFGDSSTISFELTAGGGNVYATDVVVERV